MSLLKEYKCVKIYVSNDGEFYCDVVNNSDNYKVKTFASNKLQSVEKAIDTYQGSEITDGKEYYDICIHSAKITLLKVVRKIGNRLFFNDGSDTARYNGMYSSRRLLFPKSIDTEVPFKALEMIIKKLEENRKETERLYKENRELIITAESFQKQFKGKLVDVSND
jgi:hypothetical protein